MRRFVNLSSLGSKVQPAPSSSRSSVPSVGAEVQHCWASRLRGASSQELQVAPGSFRSLSSWLGSGSVPNSNSGFGLLGSGKKGSGGSGNGSGSGGVSNRRSPVLSSSGAGKLRSAGSGSGGGASGTRSKSTRRLSNRDKAGGMDSTTTSNSRVKHDKEAKRFTLDLGDNKLARIDYKPIGRNKIELYHTEVPSELRGKGIGKLLARGAFDCAAASNLKLKLTCSYLINYMDRFADQKHKKLVEH